MKRRGGLIGFVVYIFSYLTFIFISSCTGRTNTGRTNINDSTKVVNSIPKDDVSDTIDLKQNIQVYFFIENSGSMFGYVNEYTEFVDVVSDLAVKSDFIGKKILRKYYFVNGSNPIDTIFLGESNNSEVGFLVDKLNPSKRGFNQGHVSTSDLNEMFQVALNKAKDNNLSILISDGIYDIHQKDAPRNALSIKGKETKGKFIERLNEGDFQTLIIKLKSDFKGKYYFVTQYIGNKQKVVRIQQKRPYYVWVFGKSELVNKYFSDNYLKNLNGYENHVRFINLKNIDVPYKITTVHRKGKFKFDRNNPHQLLEVSPDRRSNKFQFSFEVDYTNIPFPDSYLMDSSNYEIDGNYKIVSIEPLDKKGYTHRITIMSERKPYGKVEVSLKYALPAWIKETSTLVESDSVSEDKTFGFQALIEGISDAYLYENQNKKIVTFKFNIIK